MLRRLYDSLEKRFLIGKTSLQGIFESMHRISLRGMNYGQIADHRRSGELWVMQYLSKKFIEDGIASPVIFDVGANIGQYSEYLSQVFRSAQITAFEPGPYTHSQLQRNLANRNIHFVQAGVGERAEELELFYDEEGSVHSSFTRFELEALGRTNLKKVTVPVVSLDHYCDENRIERIHFLKLDVEGHELFALKGASRMLSERRIDFIQFEFGANNIGNHVYLKDFFDTLDGYTIARILRDGLRKLEYNYRHEIMITTNYFAFKK